MKAYLIDPFAIKVSRSGKPTVTGDLIREVDYDGNIQSIYTFLSHPLMSVDTFDVVGFPDGDSIYVDDDGLGKEADFWFRIHGFHQPLRGRGLMLGCDENGDSIAPKMTLETLRRNIQIGTGITTFWYDDAGRILGQHHLGTVESIFWHRPWGQQGVLR